MNALLQDDANITALDRFITNIDNNDLLDFPAGPPIASPALLPANRQAAAAPASQTIDPLPSEVDDDDDDDTEDDRPAIPYSRRRRAPRRNVSSVPPATGSERWPQSGEEASQEDETETDNSSAPPPPPIDKLPRRARKDEEGACGFVKPPSSRKRKHKASDEVANKLLSPQDSTVSPKRTRGDGAPRNELSPPDAAERIEIEAELTGCNDPEEPQPRQKVGRGSVSAKNKKKIARRRTSVRRPNISNTAESGRDSGDCGPGPAVDARLRNRSTAPTRWPADTSTAATPTRRSTRIQGHAALSQEEAISHAEGRLSVAAPPSVAEDHLPPMKTAAPKTPVASVAGSKAKTLGVTVSEESDNGGGGGAPAEIKDIADRQSPFVLVSR